MVNILLRIPVHRQLKMGFKKRSGGGRRGIETDSESKAKTQLVPNDKIEQAKDKTNLEQRDMQALAIKRKKP
jgi:hypothetical protein